MNEYINYDNLKSSLKNFRENTPFSHAVIDDFFKADIADALESEFPEYNDDLWHSYENQIEVKRVCNNWNVFPSLTYKVFSFLNSDHFIEELMSLTDISPLHRDSGLNGGGWHIHKKGGKLNTHLDYSIHPKLGLERKINIIIYLNSRWKKDWGGHLGLWAHDEENNAPGELMQTVECKFNRAVIFDTTQNSWHGLPAPLTCPEDECRKSFAVYYLTEPSEHASSRGKALFAPTEEQKDDSEVLELIKRRADVNQAHRVYKK